MTSGPELDFRLPEPNEIPDMEETLDQATGTEIAFRAKHVVAGTPHYPPARGPNRAAWPNQPSEESGVRLTPVSVKGIVKVVEVKDIPQFFNNPRDLTVSLLRASATHPDGETRVSYGSEPMDVQLVHIDPDSIYRP